MRTADRALTAIKEDTLLTKVSPMVAPDIVMVRAIFPEHFAEILIH